jgi:hypothetical protein
MKSLIAIAITLLAALVGMTAIQLFRTGQSHSPDADQWTYIVAAPKDEDLVHTLNQLGNQGWEIVSTRRATSGDSSPAYEMILKHKGAGVRYSEAVALLPSVHP